MSSCPLVLSATTVISKSDSTTLSRRTTIPVMEVHRVVEVSSSKDRGAEGIDSLRIEGLRQLCK